LIILTYIVITIIIIEKLYIKSAKCAKIFLGGDQVLKFVYNLFRVPSDKEYKKTLKKIARNLVKRYSTGNVSLQLGNYITEEEIKKRKKKVLSYHF